MEYTLSEFGWLLLDVGLLCVGGMVFASLVFLVGYLLRRLFKLPDTLTIDMFILVTIYLLNPLGFFDPSFNGLYDISVLWSSAKFIPFALAVIYWVHKGEE